MKHAIFALKIFAHFSSTRHPRKRQHIHAPQPDVLQNTIASKYFRPSKKWQPLAWPTRPRCTCRSRQRSGGCRGSAPRARWCRTPLGDYVARRGWCVSSFPCISRLISLELCVIFVRSLSGSDDWHRAWPQQRPGSFYRSALNKRWRLEWCTSMWQWLGETKRPHSGTSLASHSFSRSSKTFSALFRATLQTIFTPFFVVQFHAFPSQFVGFGRVFGACSFVSVLLTA